MQKITLYQCLICNTNLDQISHHKSHLNTSKHKTHLKLFRYKCKELSDSELLDKYNSKNIEKIINFMENNEIITKKKLNYNSFDDDIHIMSELSLDTNTITNREDLKDKIHEIHNFLRNNGAGYGMNALKVFNMIYGLKRLEEKGLYQEIEFNNKQNHFSNLLKLAKEGKSEKLSEMFLDEGGVLDSLHKSKAKNLLMYEIPKNINGDVFVYLLKEIEGITKLEKDCNVQLSGKIYEYFIGRDETAISELGAYFTDRHIVNYIFSKLDIQLDDDGSIGNMIDPYGGSGGFTTGFINYINDKYLNICWKTQLDNIYHFDMNEDVIKSAGLEFFLLTGILPNMEKNLGYKNSFYDEFLDLKYKYVITNPPYGGDKNKKSGRVEKRDKVKKYIEKLLKDKELSSIIREKYEKQLISIKAEEKKETKEKEKEKVNLLTSSKRINKFAEKYKLKGNDKEAVSLIQIMDMVEEGGLGCGVLKEGVFFNKTYKEHRKVLIENFEVECVISVPSSEFENTSTKTSIVIFRNNGKPTGSVKFYNMDITRYEEDKFEERDGFIVLVENEGDIKSVGDVLVSEATKEQILANDTYSLNGKEYNKREIIPGEGYEVVRLGDVCEFKPNSTKTHVGEFNLVKIKDIDNGTIINTDTIKNDLVKETNICQYNDIVLSNVRPKSRKSCLLRSSVIKNIEKYCFTMPTLRPKDGYHPVYIYSIIYPLLNTFEKTICTGSQYPTFKIEQLKDIQIPIPTDPQLLTQWVDKISSPFDESHTKSARIKELEGQVADRIREITENEECEEVELGTICELKDGYDFYRHEMDPRRKYINGENLPLLKISSDDINDYIKIDNKFNSVLVNKDDLVIGTKGTCGLVRKVKIDKAYHKHGLLKFVNIKVNKNFLFYYLINNLNKDNIEKMTTESVQSNMKKSNLIKFKLKIPKDKSLVTSLDPIFAEIERLQDEVKQADTLYHQYIDNLAKEAILSENNISPSMENNVSIPDMSDKEVERLQKLTADPLPVNSGECQGENNTDNDLNKKTLSQLKEIVRNNNLPFGRGSDFKMSSKKNEFIIHIKKHLPTSFT
tara:strand:- start:5645 stop:8851 length:3207 start_codon:yes stop_codon:yes gene_type:complete